MVDAVAELRRCHQRKQRKTHQVERLTQGLRNEIVEAAKDIEEITAFREGLRHELEAEVQLKDSITKIAAKYRKLIAEIRREKEKLAQQVVH